MNHKLLTIILCSLPIFARADSLLMSLNCVTESDFNNSKTHGVVMIDVKSSGEGVGYAVTKYVSNNGDTRLGMTYFKASSNNGAVLFSTRQNPDDIGKDADFLSLSFNNQGSDDMEIYGAVIGRGHDAIVTQKETYFCFPR